MQLRHARRNVNLAKHKIADELEWHAVCLGGRAAYAEWLHQ
jgi:hypothetical protein